MKVTLMLADFAQVADGKLTVVGGGWTFTGPQPSPFAIAALFEVPWQLANDRHSFRFELIDRDGEAVTLETPNGTAPVYFEGEFEVGRPPGLPRGATIPFPLGLNHGPIPLSPGSHFEWRLTVNGEAREDWRLAFSTRPNPQASAA